MLNEDDQFAIEQSDETHELDQTVSENIPGDSTTQFKTIPVEQRIGQLLAEGHNTPQIVIELQDGGYVKTEEEALVAIREVYASWQKIESDSQLELPDLKRWHIMMRHVLLVNTLDNNPRVALSVLESLAELQKVNIALSAEADSIPIQIRLIAAPVPNADNDSTPKETTDD